MEVTLAADLVRYHATGEGALDLRDEKLTWGQAADRVARTSSTLAAVLVTQLQVYDWGLTLRAPGLKMLLGVPLVVSPASPAHET